MYVRTAHEKRVGNAWTSARALIWAKQRKCGSSRFDHAKHGTRVLYTYVPQEF